MTPTFDQVKEIFDGAKIGDVEDARWTDSASGRPWRSIRLRKVCRLREMNRYLLLYGALAASTGAIFNMHSWDGKDGTACELRLAFAGEVPEATTAEDERAALEAIR